MRVSSRLAKSSAVEISVPRRAGLNEAKKVLSAEKDVDFDMAAHALAAVQSSLVFEYVEVDQPLQKARTNLGLAKGLFEVGNKAGAKIALEIASDSLETYGAAASSHRSQEVDALRKEIDTLISKIDESPDEASADQAADWWEKVRSWFE